MPMPMYLYLYLLVERPMHCPSLGEMLPMIASLCNSYLSMCGIDSLSSSEKTRILGRIPGKLATYLSSAVASID